MTGIESNDPGSDPQARIGSLLAQVFEQEVENQAESLDQICGEHPDLAEQLRAAYRNVESLEATVIQHHSATDRPEHIGPYRILDILGEGGMGTVYLAEQKEPVRRRVALKVIKLGMDSKQVLARFELERQALAVMNHPAIAKVFDAGVTDHGQPYFVMEHVEGVPIDAYCDKNKLSIQDRIAVFQQVCNGVQHAHQKGVLHRDLKPSERPGHPAEARRARPSSIIDFGLARATDQQMVEQHDLHRAGPADRHAGVYVARTGERSTHRTLTRERISTRWVCCCTRCLPVSCRSTAPSYAWRG